MKVIRASDSVESVQPEVVEIQYPVNFQAGTNTIGGGAVPTFHDDCMRARGNTAFRLQSPVDVHTFWIRTSALPRATVKAPQQQPNIASAAFKNELSSAQQ